MKKRYKVGLIVLALSILSTGKTRSNVSTGYTEDSGENSTLKNVTGQTPAACASITLTSQAEVDAFPATYGCPEITGSLTISGDDITNLDSLRSLTKVGGDLWINGNPNLANVSGLSSLTYVGMGGGPFPGAHITGNPKLTKLDGLIKLASIIGMLEIASNATLANVDGLASLASIGAPYPSYTCLAIRSNPALASLKGLRSLTALPGLVAIENNTSLPNLDGLNALTGIGSFLSISGNTSLTNIDGLSALTHVTGRCSGVTISNNPSLINLNGLSSLTEISGGPCTTVLDISNNASLIDLDGLSSLASIHLQAKLNVVNNPNLIRCCGLYRLLSDNQGISISVTMSGNGAGCTRDDILIGCAPAGKECSGNIILPSQAAIDSYPAKRGCKEIPGTLTISGNDITNLDSLYSLTKVGQLLIKHNPSLTRIGGLSSLSTVKQFLISDNDSLATLNGLSGLTEVGGDLTIAGNKKLSDLSGLIVLRKVSGSLGISSNPELVNPGQLSALDSIGGQLMIVSSAKLTNLDGLSGLHSIGSLSIGNNPSLTNVKGLKSIASRLSSLDIFGNALLSNLDGLNSVTEIGGSLLINNNPSLDNIDGLRSLSLVRNSIQIADNAMLRNVNGLSSLKKIGRSDVADLFITGNASLTDLDGLSNLTTMEATGGGIWPRVGIIDNPKLIRCCGLYMLFHSNGVVTVRMSGNGAGCTKEDILAGGPCCASDGSCPPNDPPGQPTNMAFSAVTDTTMTVSFTAATQAPDGYITLMKAFSAPFPDDAPADGTTYQVGNTIGSSTIVVGVGTGTSLDIVYLWPGIEYYFDVFSYNNSTRVYDYLTVNPLEGSQRTSTSGSPSARMNTEQAPKLSEHYSADNDRISPFPNPFSEDITIPFTTKSQNTSVQIVIYDPLGRRIAEVANRNFGPGYHEAKWGRTDSQGNKVLQGMYLYSIKTNEAGRIIRGTVLAK